VIPEGPGHDRDAYILNAAATGAMTYQWAQVASQIPGHTATFAVFADAAKIDGLRVGVGARVLQQIADTIGASLLTPRLQDLMYQQAPTKILPWLDYTGAVFPWAGKYPSKMQSAEWFRRSTAGIDKLLAAAGYKPGTLAQGMGKPWMLDNDLLTHPGMAENYGFYVPRSKLSGGKYQGVGVEPSVSLPEIACLQGRGWKHPLDQDDYSELIVLVSRQCVVDGDNRDFADVLRDPVLSALVSHQGPLKVVRQPGVPLASCATGVGRLFGFGYGESGTEVCKIKLTGLPGGGKATPVVSSSSSSPGEVVLAAVGVFGLAALGWWGYRSLARRMAA
jgi:hypothetical protein